MNDSCRKVFIDGHAHLHDPASIEELCYHAAENFSRQPEFDPRCCRAVIMLAQIGDNDFLAQQWNTATQPRGGWRLAATREVNSLKVIRDDGFVLWVLTGRQLVSSEGVEVLLFGGAQMPATKSLAMIIAEAAAQNGLVVLPWGAGKWLGNRGRLISDLLSGVRAGDGVLLGDNGGRPALWGRVSQFELARAKGVKMLNGSDPLPVAGELERVGSFGNVLRGDLDEERPCASLISQLREPRVMLEPFGAPLSLGEFVKKQLMLRFCR